MISDFSSSFLQICYISLGRWCTTAAYVRNVPSSLFSVSFLLSSQVWLDMCLIAQECTPSPASLPSTPSARHHRLLLTKLQRGDSTCSFGHRSSSIVSREQLNLCPYIHPLIVLHLYLSFCWFSFVELGVSFWHRARRCDDSCHRSFCVRHLRH